MKPKTLNTIYIIFIGFITAFTFLIHYEPALYSDDWLMISQNYFGSISFINWGDKRPLFFTYFQLIYFIAKLNINIFNLISCLTTFFSALLIFTISKKFQPNNSLFSFCFSLLYLLLPYDLSRTWLMNSYIHFSFLLFLIFVIYLYKFKENNNWVLFGSGIISLAASILMYEGHLLLIFIWCSFLFILEFPNKKKRFVYLSPIIFIPVYSIYRVLNNGNLHDNYLSQISTTPSEIFKRVIESVKLLVFGFTQPLRDWFGFNGNLIPFILLLAAVLFPIAILKLLELAKRKEKNNSFQQRFEISKKMFLNIIIGLMLLFAGYFPILMLIPPNISGVCSRVNFFILPGAAYTIISTLTFITFLVFKKEKLAWTATFLSTLPLLCIGLFVQIDVQKDNQQAWWEQKNIWQALFTSLPDISDHSYVVINYVLDKNTYPEYADFACSSVFDQRMPLVYPWDVRSGLRMLYNNGTLDGDIMGPQLKHSLTFEEEKILSRENYSVSYDRVIFVEYDRESRETRIIADPQKEFSLPFTLENYNPFSLILKDTPLTKARALVE